MEGLRWLGFYLIAGVVIALIFVPWMYAGWLRGVRQHLKERRSGALVKDIVFAAEAHLLWPVFLVLYFMMGGPRVLGPRWGP